MSDQNQEEVIQNFRVRIVGKRTQQVSSTVKSIVYIAGLFDEEGSQLVDEDTGKAVVFLSWPIQVEEKQPVRQLIVPSDISNGNRIIH